jgi:arylsulfatase A-like enzyme
MKGGKSARFKDENLTRTVVEQSNAFLEAHKNGPFFLYVGFFEPHVPRVATSSFAKTSQSGVRGDVIQQLDWATGEILKTLDRLKLATNTLVIFTSDNGPIFFDGYFDHSKEDANGHQPAGNLRGWKYLVYEGGCRVPLIARWPARIKPNVTEQMFSLVDLHATLATIGNGQGSTKYAPDSIDLSRVLLGLTDKNLRDNTVLHGISDTLALRQGDWKYIPANSHQRFSGMGSGINVVDQRFSENRIEKPLLFNLANDPSEKVNVIEQFPEQAEALRKRLQDIIHLKTTGDEK